ncbi:MAG: methylmalonyl-CoA mutase family protein [Planctomycetota bacterium]
MPTAELDLTQDFPPVAYDTWRQAVEQTLRGAPFDKKLVTHTYEGIDLQPVYAAENWPCAGDPSGFPGLSPATRGAAPSNADWLGWDARQEHADPDLEQSNQRILEDLLGGATSLQLRLDAAGRFGLDADHPNAQTLAGRDGLILSTPSDWRRLLQGVKLDIAGVALEAGAAFLPAAAQLVAQLDEQGVDRAKARGAFNADPLAVLARRGEFPSSLDHGMKLLGDLAAFTDAELPGFTSVRVGTAPYHHAGATAAQDLGLSLATGVAYLRAMESAGLEPEHAARQLLFSVALGTNLFLAVAKLRAARRLWSQVLEGCGVSPGAAPMRIHCRASKRVLTQRDPYANLLRNTVCCFAGALGGAQVITAEPFDKALGLPDTFSRRIARNTHAVLSEEAHVARVLDPAGGSWMIESMTDGLAEKGWAFFRDIEKQGGMAEALASGWVRQQIDSAFAPRAKNIARRRDPVTGVSEFPNLGEAAPPQRKPDLKRLLPAAHARLAEERPEHPDGLARLTETATFSGTSPGDVSRAALTCAQAGASLGQLSSAVYAGRHRTAQPPLAPHPYAEPFEKLRDASDRHLELTGRRPQALLVTLGAVAEHTVRAGFSRNLFEAGGIETHATPAITGDPQAMAEQAAAQASDAVAALACVCSSDPIYQEAAEPVARALKEAGVRTVVLAGFPGDREDAYRAAGVDRFIYLKCDVLQTLTDLLAEAGALV